MRRRWLLPLAASVSLVLAFAGIAHTQDLDLPTPPDADVTSPDVFIPEGTSVPQADAEAIHEGFPIGPPCCSMIDTPPTPVPYPGLELWEGFCNHHDGLADVCCDCKPCVWGAIDVLWLARDNDTDAVLALDGGGDTVLSSSNFDFDDEAGIRLTYGRLVGCTPVEFTYFGSYDWRHAIEVESEEDDADLVVPIGAFDNGAFTEADEVEVQYESELESFELNALKRECCQDVTLLGGVRFIAIDERLDLEAEDEDDGEGEFSVDADNYLLGMQAGGALERTCGRWTLGAAAKAGVYLNSSEARYAFLEEDDDDDVDEGAGQDDTQAAFVGEVLLGATYCLGAGFSLRGGYQITWINGVALAPDQFGNDEDPGDEEFEPVALDADGALLYDGAYLGLHWTR